MSKLMPSTAAYATIVVDNLTDKVVAGKQQINLQPGTNQVTFNFMSQNPKLWWPNGLGAQPLYSFPRPQSGKRRVTDEKNHAHRTAHAGTQTDSMTKPDKASRS